MTRSGSFIAILISCLTATSFCRADAPLPGATQRLVVSGQGFFPVAQRLSDKRIAVVLRGGAAHVGIKGRLDIVFSSDDGKSWSTPSVVIDSPLDDRNPAFGEAKDGTLVVAFWRAAKDGYQDYEKDDPSQPVSTWVTRSVDQGKSWSAPTEIDVREIGYGSPYGKMLTQPDGTILMNVYGHGVRAAGQQLTEKTDHSYLFQSRDNGKTWARFATIAAHFNETGLLRLEDGTLLAALRSAGGKSSVALSRSNDQGKTWSAPQTLSEPNAHPADLLLLPDNRILLVTGFRNPPLGVRGVIGNATGQFDWANRFALVSDSTNTDTGYPSSVLLDGKRALTFYYAVGSKTHPEWGVHCGLVEYPLPQ